MNDVERRVLANMLCRSRQCWEQGMAGIALHEMGETALLIAAADDMLVRQHADGRLAVVEDSRTQTDPALAIQTVLRAAELTGEAQYLEAARRSLAFFKTTPWQGEDGIIYHICGTQQVWSDTAAMLPASLAMLGEKAMAVRQLLLLCDRLRLPNGLYGHIWDDGRQAWIDPQPWSAGCGWILVGLAWTIGLLDAGAPAADTLFALHRDLVAALAPFRTSEGLYHNIADDPATFVECQTACALAYSEVLLHLQGRLGREALVDARRTLETIGAHIDAHGAVHDCPGSPTFAENGTSTEMQAFYLMLSGALKRAENR